MKMLLVMLVSVLLAARSASAQFDLGKVLKGLGGSAGNTSGLSDARVGAGLQEALR
jgi:hypothetical protein